MSDQLTRPLRYILGLLVLTGSALAGCSSGEEPNGSGSEIFVTDPSPDDIMPVDGRDVIVDQMLLMFEEDVSPAEARVIVGEMEREQEAAGLKLVGQIPPLGIYQLEVQSEQAEAAAAVAALDAVMDALRAYPRVQTVSYNELLQTRFAENDDDNTAEEQLDRAAHAIVDYFQAIPVFDKVLNHVTLHPVKVAVLDSGIDLGSEQFDEIQSYAAGFEYLDVGFPDNPPMDIHPSKHGTAVAGIIAADNGDGITNGIASRVLGQNLSLFVGNVHTAGNFFHAARTISGAELAIERGARIINISHGTNAGGDVPPWLATIRENYLRLFQAEASQNVLFVVAASNDRLVLDENDAPAGMLEPNVLTVGGVNSADFNIPYFDSATGPGVEIAGPATHVPVCCFSSGVVGYARQFLDGNSFAAPMVTSMAAMLLSVDPEMTAAEIKSFITSEDHTHRAPEEVGGLRPALLKTVGHAILQRAAPSSSVDDVMDVIYGFDDGIPDPSGHMVNRLVGSIDFSVTGPNYTRHHIINADELTFNAIGHNFGIIGASEVVVSFAKEGQSETVAIGITRDFALDRLYRIPTDAGLLLRAGGDGGDFTGTGVFGGITLHECEVTTRSIELDSFDRYPDAGLERDVFIEVSGSLVGARAEGAVASDPPVFDVSYAVSGTFRTAFRLLGVDEGTQSYIEEHCLGGFTHRPPGP